MGFPARDLMKLRKLSGPPVRPVALKWRSLTCALLFGEVRLNSSSGLA
jgi:hypothetical protein